ncbi:flagellar basal body P-ring formation chaperone FlgA [Ideonella sp. BN130291]|uniref:flagellar basal body P-ring formation chaperone FlgA n=1 Tax=Ideonella sp. BN130291 TaxID=3112940 RepID=UPI002E25BD33|nr:flagellar basal body P-ring formation chaperone FlgA [Ideonella sp. BN130291]
MDKSLRTLLISALWCWIIGVVLSTVLVVGAASAAEGDASALAAPLAQQVEQMAQAAGQRASGGHARVEVLIGQLDPRLRLAPCERIEPYLPAGSPAWGKTRVGLRCLQGPSRWNVFLPVTVKVFGRALVVAGPLPAGSTLAAADLREAEVDLAAAPGTALTQAAGAVGRTLARPLAAGDTLRQTDLKARQYFAAGDTVQVLAVGAGYSVSGAGQALSPGLEGQPVRVRTDSGRIVSGMAVAEHRVEIPL